MLKEIRVVVICAGAKITTEKIKFKWNLVSYLDLCIFSMNNPKRHLHEYQLVKRQIFHKEFFSIIELNNLLRHFYPGMAGGDRG